MDVREELVIGGPESFMNIRHLTVHGTNFDIGRAVGELCVQRYGQSAQRLATEPVYGRARRAYFQQHYPMHWERVRGVAAALGVDPEDDHYDVSQLLYNVDLPRAQPACSAVYYPPAVTTSSGGYLSRNYDFSTGTVADIFEIPLPPEVRARQRPCMSEPYLMEWYPEDGGYASLAMQAFDVLSGTLDGTNSAGLVVSILADDEGIARLGPNIEMHPETARAVGLHELQVMRLLLDTCATVDQACATLLLIKDYYGFVPTHYIVADRAGHSFIYEHSTGRNVQYVFDGPASRR